MLENKKIGRLSLGKSPRRNQSTTALQSSDDAKVQQNIDICKENLKNLANKWKNVNDVQGFLTDLWSALKMSDDGKGTMGNNPSKYSYFKLPDGTDAIISIRASAHNADCANYLDKPGSFNLGIVLQRRNKPNTFKAHPDVKAEEYVYTNQRIKSIESPLSQIAYSLIKFLDGEGYTDTTGVAIKHQSPQSEEPQKLEENKQHRNTNTIMKQKQTIRLTDSQLRGLIKESIKKVLNEQSNQGWDFYQPNNIKVESLQEMYEIARDIFGIDGGEQKALTIDFHYKGKIIELYASNVPDGLFWNDRCYSIQLRVWDEGEQRPNWSVDIMRNDTGYELDYSTLKEKIKYCIVNQPS